MNKDFDIVRFLRHEMEESEAEQFVLRMASDAELFSRFKELQASDAELAMGIIASHTGFSYKDLIRRRKKKMRLHILRITAVAASILFCITGGGLLWVYTMKEKNALSERKQTATLVLSSGESLALDFSGTRIIEDGSGGIITGGGGMLIYTEKEKFPDKTVSENILSVPRGNSFKVVLGDRTSVWLNSDSRLSYPVCFSGNKREVQLSGEAYFKVVRDSLHPFVVHMGDFSVEVTGTEFVVNTHEENQIETVLVNGEVCVCFGDRKQKILPGQKAAYNIRNKEIEIIDLEDVESHTAWREGDFYFRAESLEAIMRKLSRWYDIEVVFIDEKAKHIALSGNLYRDKDVFKLFDSFEKISDVRFSIKGKTVYIRLN